jgi:hypothetical protein
MRSSEKTGSSVAFERTCSSGATVRTGGDTVTEREERAANPPSEDGTSEGTGTGDNGIDMIIPVKRRS